MNTSDAQVTTQPQLQKHLEMCNGLDVPSSKQDMEMAKKPLKAWWPLSHYGRKQKLWDSIQTY